MDEIELELWEPEQLSEYVAPAAKDEDSAGEELNDGENKRHKKSYPTSEKILDGITVEIERISIVIRTLGKLKTHRLGGWYGKVPWARA